LKRRDRHAPGGFSGVAEAGAKENRGQESRQLGDGSNCQFKGKPSRPERYFQ
jgi:hypothetical protein